MKNMRSRSLEVRLPPSLNTHPYVVGQNGVNYQIFDKIGNGSFGAVFDVKKVILNINGEFVPCEESKVELVVKIIDVTDENFEEQDYVNELKIL